MGRVALKRLTVYNFRSFFGRHEVEFDDKGLYLIRGSNNDSHGESGAGKSSLLLAIAYALNFAPYSLAELTSWDATDPMWVELELHTDQGPVILHRGDKLWMKVGNGKPLTSAKSVEERLTAILHIAPSLREAITFRRQRKPGMFLAMRDSEKKSFLVELLGLEWLEKEIAGQVKVVTNAQKDVDLVQIALTKAQADLDFAESNVTPLEYVDVSQLEHSLDEVSYQAEDIRRRLSDLSQMRNKAADSYVPDRTEADRLKGLYTECIKRESRAQANEDKLRAEYTSLQIEYRQQQKSIHDLQLKRVVLLQREQILSDNRCSECKRQWEEASTELDTVHEQLSKLSDEIDRLKSTQPPDPFVSNGQLEKLRDLRISMENQISKEELSIELDRSSRIDQYQSQIDVLVQELAEKNKDIYALQLEVQRTRLANNASADKSNLEQKLIQRYRTIRNEETTKHITAKSVLSMEQDYLEMLRGFMSKYFADILTQISDEANKIIGNLPNTSHVTLYFDVERETQDGKMRNEITPVIYFGDKKWSLEAGASGGMYTSIELAVDLAVGRIIADRTGCDIGWLILDESFNGHDKITKESCLHILQQYAADKLIVIVDHASEMKEFFSKIIDVSMSNGRTTIATT